MVSAWNLLVFIYCFSLVESMCHYPCSRLHRATYVGMSGSTMIISKFSCEEPNKVTHNGITAECYIRDGPFLVQRREGNMFRCVKQMAVDPTGLIAILYVLPYTNFTYNPTLCEVCSVPGTWEGLYFRAVKSNDNYMSDYKVKALGCNVPKGCPIKNPCHDIPCTGCEPNEDDGLCCAACQTNSPAKNKDK